MELKTERLQIVACTPEMLKAALTPHDLGHELGCGVPASWMSCHARNSAMDVMEKIESGEFGEGYGIWCSVLRDRRPVMVGAVGCAPGKDGEGAILDFETLPEFEGQGYATEGAQALMGWLMGHEGLKKITADVDGEEGAAIRVLLKLGFAEMGRSADGKKLHFEAVAR